MGRDGYGRVLMSRTTAQDQVARLSCLRVGQGAITKHASMFWETRGTVNPSPSAS